jgi:hypothetical protein
MGIKRNRPGEKWIGRLLDDLLKAQEEYIIAVEVGDIARTWETQEKRDQLREKIVKGWCEHVERARGES